MDQKQIEEIVRSVMASMGRMAPAPSEARCATANCAAPMTSESYALGLGSAEAKAWIGVENPHRADVLTELRRSTVAHVCTGRAGPRPRTQALLCLLADHSRSKDTVLKEVPEEQVKAQGLLEVRSEISDKNLYLTRPDMGHRLCAEAVEALEAQYVANPDVQVVTSNGLPTGAITVNYEEILPPLMAGLKQAGLKVGTPLSVRYGRVKIEDQIGEVLGAKVVVLLVGERPGLGQSEGLFCYTVYSPRMVTTVEADRTCISNIHQGGAPPVEAVAVTVGLAKRMLGQRAFGINMTRQGGVMPALDLIRPSVTAMRVIASVNVEFTRELKLPPHTRSLGLISVDSDDVTYIAVDEATKQAMAEVVYGRSLYAGATHSPSPTAGEVLIMFSRPNPAEVRAGLDAMVTNIENGAVFQWANDAENTAFLAHVVSRTGSYLSLTAGITLGDSVVYLVAPPLGATYGIDAALKSTDVQSVIYVPPPSETDYSTALSTGSQAACKAACNAFVDAVLEVARNPIQRA